MQYLKSTFGGLSRTFTDSAAQAFHGPHRWWKLAFYAAMFILPGGSLGVLLIAWLDGRRGKGSAADAARSQALIPPGAVAAPAVAPCSPRTEVASPCRAAASRLAVRSR